MDYDFLFRDEETGEEFFVECATKDEAWAIVEDNFGSTENFRYCGRYSVEEAEMWGLDTY